MPNFGLHVLLAHRVAEAWRIAPRDAPFDVEDARSLNAFLHGAVGPDMGMYPGGQPLLSDLVHHVRSGRFVASLLARADREFDRAYAWGWLTHILADTLLHPIVNREAAQVLGRTEVDLSDRMLLAAHVRVELGLDSEYLMRYPLLQRVQLRPAFDADGVRFVVDAYEDTYGVRFAAADVLRSHAAVLRLHRHLLFLQRYVAHRRGYRATGAAPLLLYPLLGAARWIALCALDPATPAAGMLTAVSPSRALRAATNTLLRRLPRLLRPYLVTGMASLEDLDLETGEVEDPFRPTRRAVQTLDALARRGTPVDGQPAAA